MKLWYNSPASKWQEGLPIGNGRIGVVVESGKDQDIWTVNESTYWSGQSVDTPADQYGGKEALDKVRNLFFENKYDQGTQLAEEYFAPRKHNFGTNIGVCKVNVKFETQPGESLFKRVLDLNTATVTSGRFPRNTFASHADQTVVAQYEEDFEVALEGLQDAFKSEASVLSSQEGRIEFTSQALEDVHSDGSCGVRCKGLLSVSTDGTVASQKGSLVVTGAKRTLVLFTLDTDFCNESWTTAASSRLDDLRHLSFDTLHQRHVADYSPLYQRVTIDLEDSFPNDPTDLRASRLKTGVSDSFLHALYFQYGRYLMIAGSREDSVLPINLQGLWNDGEANKMSWSCDYHLDINTQMNYYPTEVAALSECHVPLMNYVVKLAKDGHSTATNFYGSRGWVAHVFSNVWGFTDPGWETSWGLNVSGGLWLATHMIEHYEFTEDEQFLKQQAYPVLEEAALFFLDYMRTDPRTNYLVTGPSPSPENSFFVGQDSKEYHLCMGATLDIVLVRDLFKFLIKHKSLQKTNGLDAELSKALGQLPPLKVTSSGQLQEWPEEFKEAQPNHRHLSHLQALYRSNQINEGTPELWKAALVTLQKRVSKDDLEDIEFTAALMGQSYARLHDGNNAVIRLSHLISELSFSNLFSFSKPGVAGAENDIFVIDGNFGGASLVAEMLLQSQNDEVHILPALPDEWKKGQVTGLRARGQIAVDIKWDNNQLETVTVKNYGNNQKTTVAILRYKNQRKQVSVGAAPIEVPVKDFN
jgi:alpha-L-fucosidase 2